MRFAATRPSVALSAQSEGWCSIASFRPHAAGGCGLNCHQSSRPHDLVQGLSAVAEATARGVLSPEEAQDAAAVLEHHRRAVETLDLERRIAAIEDKQNFNER